ncbi:undecaprenyl-diphosphate phosphatase [Alphaproteobacteria bacterium]|nr:undecaprenyl-diphosphate phosphatase [Alphaproteobacteria bacterium]
MSILHLFILSSIQGITEFLPISSSGHLILLPALSGQPEQGLMIDIAVHLGTLLSVMIIFRNDVFNIVVGIPWIFSKNKKKNSKLASLLILSSIPLGVAGIILWFTDAIFILRSPVIIASTTLGFGILLYFSDKFFLTVRNLDNMNFFQAFIIGLSQVLALIPGTSRAGITITTARLFGFERREAARYTMLLSIPAIIMPGILLFAEVIERGNPVFTKNVFLAGGISFFFSLLAIKILMYWVQKSTFTIFAIYRIFLGSLIFLWIFYFDYNTIFQII